MSVENKRVFMDIEVGNKPLGRIEIELFNSTVPQTAENFRSLCVGDSGLSSKGKRLCYRGSPIHRVIKNFMIQGGDITDGDGRGGYSIYGKYFDDENFTEHHSRPYLVSMANKGPNTNSSQFFITTAPAPHCNGKHVVFGQVVRGHDVVDQIELIAVDSKGKPDVGVIVSNCGQLFKKKKDANIEKERLRIEQELEEKKKIPDCPKSWLYRDDQPSNTTRKESDHRYKREGGSRRRRSRSHSKSRSRTRRFSRSRSSLERRDKSRSRYRGRDRATPERSDKRKEIKTDDNGVRVRGRGTIRFNSHRSGTPPHWRQHEPTKLIKVEENNNEKEVETNNNINW